MKLLALIASAITASFAFPASAAEPVHVMILGTYHFDNPGQDLNNIKADDVLKPRRQEELEALASALATFKPTKIMVERVARTPDLIDPHFTSFAPDKLRQERDERYQIGYRMAYQLKLGRVYAIDEQPEKGEPDYFPFGAVAEYAQANGMGERLKKMMATPAAETKAFEERQRTQSIAQLLLHSNEPTGFYSSIGGYYETLAIGDQPPARRGPECHVVSQECEDLQQAHDSGAARRPGPRRIWLRPQLLAATFRRGNAWLQKRGSPPLPQEGCGKEEPSLTPLLT